MPPTRPLVAVAAAFAALLSLPAPASAVVTRSCGADPIANTASVLCAPPSGPCDAATVVLSASIRVLDTACVFDLEGRGLRVERTLAVAGNGDDSIIFTNAGDVTIARHGRLKARGDLVRPNGVVRRGGDITVTSTGAIDVAGTVDASGELGGLIRLDADGDVTLARTARIRSNGIGGAFDLGARAADAGDLLVDSLHGSIRYAGQIQLRGANGGSGGDVDMSANHDLDIGGKSDLSGGNNDGGFFFAGAADDLRVARALVDVRSRAGGADSGDIDLRAGITYSTSYSTTPDGLRPGGTLTIAGSRFDLRGSANDKGFAGTGGFFDTQANGGDIIVADDVAIRCDGAASTLPNDGSGGAATFLTYGIPADPGIGRPALRGDVKLGGLISVRGDGVFGYGGDLLVSADRDAVLGARVDVSAADLSGRIWVGAGRDILVSAPLAATALAQGGTGGTVQLVAGLTEVGALHVADSIRARGGARSSLGSRVILSGCPVTVDAGVTIDASGSTSGGPLDPPALLFHSGRPLELNDGGRFLAGPAGTISATHPATQGPVIGSAVVFDPPLLDVIAPAEQFPLCPRCGDGPGDACAPTVRIDDVASAANRIDVAATVASAIGLPLSGSVAVCDGTGIEDVTFTWAGNRCDLISHDTLELTLNDTVVADVSQEVDGGCSCNPNAPFSRYTVSFDVAQSLLLPGVNRFGFRKTGGEDSADRTRIYWAYVTVTVNGVAERIPLFDARDLFETPGTSSFDAANCSQAFESGAIDATGETVVCNPIAGADWSGGLPCTLDLEPIPADTSYTLVIRATDGYAAQPVSAAAPFTRAAEPTLSFNGCRS